MLRVTLSVLVGVVLLATALGKALDVPGYVNVLDSYQTFPLAMHWFVAIFVIAFEAAVGLAILFPISNARGALLSLAMHLSYATLAWVTLLRGITVPNCGCFGVFLARPLGWNTVIEDLVMVGISYVIYRLRQRTR